MSKTSDTGLKIEAKRVLHSITTLDHPPYFPDLALVIFLFLKCKIVMRRQHWNDIETTHKLKTTRQLRSLIYVDFEGCFDQWKRRWNKCIATDGEYFEDDKINI